MKVKKIAEEVSMDDNKIIAPLSEDGSNKVLEELSAYRALGTPDELKTEIAKQFELVDKISKVYVKLREQFNITVDVFNEAQAMMFIIIRDKLIADGRVSLDMTEDEMMSAVIKEYDTLYKNADTSSMKRLMVDYYKGGHDDET